MEILKNYNYNLFLKHAIYILRFECYRRIFCCSSFFCIIILLFYVYHNFMKYLWIEIFYRNWKCSLFVDGNRIFLNAYLSTRIDKCAFYKSYKTCWLNRFISSSVCLFESDNVNIYTWYFSNVLNFKRIEIYVQNSFSWNIKILNIFSRKMSYLLVFKTEQSNRTIYICTMHIIDADILKYIELFLKKRRKCGIFLEIFV